MNPLLTLAAAQVAVVGPNGPELHEAPPPLERFVTREEPKDREPECLRPARIFHYTAATLDVATTIAGLEGNKNLEEGNPIVTAVLGKRPSPIGLIAMKAIPVFAIRKLDEHFVRHGNPKYACVLNIGFGVPALAAAGLNARFVF